MARKREVSFFHDVQTDEIFEAFLEQEELIILDVYCAVFGPAVSLHYMLVRKKIALDDSETVQMATCNSDKITRLKRFRNKSIPTIIFCRHAKVIDIMYGTDLNLISPTFDKYYEICQDNARYEKLERYEFDQMLPFEIEIFERKKKEEEARLKAKLEAAQALKQANLDKIIEIMNKNAGDMGVTLYMPHVAKFGLMKTYETAKSLKLVNRAEQWIKLIPEIMDDLNYTLENPIDERILEHIYHQDIYAVLWYTNPPNPITSVLKNFKDRVSKPRPVVYEEEGIVKMETLLESLVIEVETEKEEMNEALPTEPPVVNVPDNGATGDVAENVEEEKSEEEEKEDKHDENSEKVELQLVIELTEEKNQIEQIEEDSQQYQQENEEDENETEEGEPGEDEDEESEAFSEESSIFDENCIVIKPVWTPKNQSGNAMFMSHFFRKQFESFLPQSDDDTPFLCIIFPAKVYEQVFEVCKRFQNGLIDFGFFSGDDFDNYELICPTEESFKETKQTGNEKLITKIAKKTSLLALNLVELGPLYVSQNPTDAKEECLNLFINKEE